MSEGDADAMWIGMPHLGNYSKHLLALQLPQTWKHMFVDQEKESPTQS